MTRLNFGTKNQIHFDTQNEKYEVLGFLAKSDDTTSLTWEHNEDSGAWGSEGRIHCYKNIINFPVSLSRVFSSGVGNIEHRINCNEFIEYIRENHNFVLGNTQSIDKIRNTIPTEYINDFERGLNL